MKRAGWFSDRFAKSRVIYLCLVAKLFVFGLIILALVIRSVPLALFTDSTRPLIDAEAEHRGHAIIEHVIADLKNSALANLPSGKFTANAAWLACAAIAFNLTRALGVAAGGSLAKAETATIRARVINIPARTAGSARRLHLHLPRDWLWESLWLNAWRHTTSAA